MAKRFTNKNKSRSRAVHEEQQPVLVVGIGASAGGLPAFTEFLSHTPAHTGMAFVLLPHLDPTHKSVMKDLLKHKTDMPVFQAAEAMEVKANSVYVLDPAHGLTIADGKLHLAPRIEPKSRWQVVDQFLRSLAHDQQERAVGIILSGTGQHGIIGLNEIKQAGGLVLAQTPESCAYQQMPQRAIDEGLVDWVLQPADMPAALQHFADYSHLKDPLAPNDISPQVINGILTTLRSRSRYDFHSHRKNMLIRRILRRMGLRHLGSLEDYTDLLNEDPQEVEALIRDLLIGVTAFFRDPLAFDVLQEQVLPALVERSSASAPLRVWVPGCSTGEEAYTLGMLLLEAFEAANKTPYMQIFATDLNGEALGVARQGFYSASQLKDIPLERLNKFFVKLDNARYQISQNLRDAMVFASQNLLGDPPFSHLDLISCRNLLIYLQPELQSRVIQLFHFALNDDGYLLLGPSETIGRRSELFSVVSKKWRVFRRRPTTERPLVAIPVAHTMPPRGGSVLNGGAGPVTESASFSDIALKTLLADYVPATVMINQHYDILQFYGATSNFLEFPGGEPTLNLMLLLRRGLSARVRAVASHAWKEQQTATDPNAQVQRNGHYYPCRLVARPVPASVPRSLLLISFEDRSILPSADTAVPGMALVPEDQRLIEQLEYELKATRVDQLKQLEELESTNESLKVSNEEMMSINEELQSANEELETSKEELQSVNEELHNANAELQSKVEELAASNDDIFNLLESSDIATLFLDRDLHIKLFNQPMAELMNLRRIDLNRPIADISSRVQSEDFISEALYVLDKLARVERIVSSKSADAPRTYLRRMLPYRANDNRIGGVVIKFVDITERYQQEKLLEKHVEARTAEVVRSREQLSLVLQAAVAAVWEMDRNRNRELITLGMHEMMFGALPADSENSWDWWMGRIHPEERENVASSLEEALDSDRNRWSQDYRFRMGGDTYHWVSDIAHISRDDAGVWQRITGAMIDINERRMAAILAHAGDALIVFNRAGSVCDFNEVAEQMFGYTADEVLGKPVEQLIAQRQREDYQKVVLADRPFKALKLAMQRQQLLAQRKDGSVFPVEIKLSSMGLLDMMGCVVHDLSEVVELEQIVGEISSWEQETVGRELHDSLGQRLTGLRMLAMRLRGQFSQSDATPAQMMDDIIEQLKEVALEVSRISHGLAPISAEPDGLADALTRLMERVDNSGDVRCLFQAEPGIIVGDHAVAHQVYRIAQEALNNALKYADARHINITLTRSGDQLELCVEDDGLGFDMAKLGKEPGLGLRIMRYRANTIGALFIVDSDPGEGTSIHCIFPASAFSR